MNEPVYEVHVVLDAADVQAQSKLLDTISKDGTVPIILTILNFETAKFFYTSPTY